MGLGERTARHHETTASKTAGVSPSIYWDFQPGQKVMTVDGFPGVVASVEDGPVAGTETYVVTLANDMGGGFYTTSQLSSVSEVTASEIHTAADDYPELGTTLIDHPDIAPNKTAARLPVRRDPATGIEMCHKKVDGFPCAGLLGHAGGHDVDWDAAYAHSDEECPDCNGSGAVPSQGGEDPAEVSNGAVKCPTCGGSGTAPKGQQYWGSKRASWSTPGGWPSPTPHTENPLFYHGPTPPTAQPVCPCGAHHDPALHETTHSFCNSCGISGHSDAVHTKAPYQETPYNQEDTPVLSSRHTIYTGQKDPDLDWEEYRQRHSHHVSGEDVNCADLDHCPSICDHTPENPCGAHRKDSVDSTGKKPHDTPKIGRAIDWTCKDCKTPYKSDPQKTAGCPNCGSGNIDVTPPYPYRPAKAAAFDPWQILTTAAGDSEFRFEVTASWSDVRKKAKRIVKDGGVHVTLATEGMVIAEIQGDHYTYETGLQRHPGRQAVAAWSCGCKWGAYHWGASDDFSRFAGRMCSHALALQYEAQSQGMFGNNVKVDTVKPRWVPRTVVVKYDIDDNKNVRAPGSSIPTSAVKTGGVSFPQCAECGSTDHHSGQHNFGEPTDHEHVGYVQDGIMCRDCVEKGKVKTDNPDPISWNELRAKEVHGSSCDHCGKEITPARPHTESECEYGDECPDLDKEYGGEGHISENDPRRATFGTEEDRQNVEDENKAWQAGAAERAKHRNENDQNAEHEINQIGTPDERKFLENNPTGPSKWSSLSVAAMLVRYAIDQGEQIGEITLAMHSSGMSLPTIQAAVNNAWGEPDPAAKKNIPGPTKAPDPTENPASAGWASGNDPDSWQQAGPSGVNHMVASRRADMCQNCGEEIHDSGGIDPSVPWVHAGTGNSYCDVHGTNDAAMLAGSPLDRGEADPVFHESALDDLTTASSRDETLFETASLRDEAMFEPEDGHGTEAELHAAPEGALPTTDSDVDNDPFRGAGDIRSPNSLEPEDPSFVSTGSSSTGETHTIQAPDGKWWWQYHDSEYGEGPEDSGGPHDSAEDAYKASRQRYSPSAIVRFPHGSGGNGWPPPWDHNGKQASVEDVVAQFQATAGAQALNKGGPDSDGMDIAQAAKDHLAKEALKAFTPSEQYQIINEGSDVKAANLDRLNLTGTHYKQLEEALKAQDDAADDEDSWLS